ncbi:MAG: hypothetical protein Q4D98_02430 [Planctomycetia bacterium]|nr:hypothetical protein [Planctomycetia bacterium]
MNFHPEEDFLLVVDHRETVTLTRPLGDLNLVISSAWRVERTRKASKTSVAETDETIWILPDGMLGGEVPFLGDQIQDAQEKNWIVCEVQHLNRIGCWRVTAINMTLRYGLNAFVDWYRPVWSLDTAGVPTPEYKLVLPGIAAKIVPSSQVGQAWIFVQHPRVRPGIRDCLITPENHGYRVRGLEPASSWQELTKITVEEMRHEC